MQNRSNLCLAHHLVCCHKCTRVEDAGRRMAETINLKVISHTWEELVNGYMAFKLEDGTTNGTLYDSKPDAVKWTDETQHFYFCFRQAMGGVSALDCQLLLNFCRYAREAGIPMAEPGARRQPSLILSTYGHDV